jgi:hypothetical protein
MKILAKLEKSFDCWFLIIISVVFFFLRFPSLFEPNWYGDEGIYQTLGLAMNAGRLLYKGIFDNKPPLLYFLYSLVSSDEFLIRLISLVFGLLAIITFFYLSKKLFKNEKASYVSTSIFAVLFGLPLIEGNIANAENFMLFPNLLAGFLVFKSQEQESISKKNKILFLAGVIIGVSFLFKIVALFDFAAFLGFIFFVNFTKRFLDIFKLKNLTAEVKNLIPIIFGFLTPIIFITLIFILNGAFSDLLKATFFSNIGYVSYGNKLIIPQGFLILKLVLLFAFCLFIFYKRKSFGLPFTFVSLWLAFALFSAYFSQRPYTHYVLVLIPSFCLMIGIFIANKHSSRISGVLILSSFIAILLSFNFYVQTIFYYQNFTSFILGAKSVTSYQSFFDRNTPRDYRIAGYINSNIGKEDNLFIWGNNAQIYDLTNKLPPGKYAVAYHITSYKDGLLNTKEGLDKSKPKFIIVMPNVPTFPFSLSNYYQKINISGVEIYERFY